MKMRCLSSSLLLSVVALVTACGSDTKGGGPAAATGGAGGSAATTGGTAAGSSGSPSSSGGSAGMSSSSSGGAAGMTVGGGGGAGGFDPATFGCPMSKPMEGAECTRMIPGACSYDDGGCVCTSGAWDCYAKSDCPATAPADAASCDLSGMACAYDDLNCTCNTTSGWSCSKPCPMAQPEDSAECRRAAGNTCRYAAGALVQNFMTMADTTCACQDGKFNCFGQADCPTAAPTSGATCDSPTLSCSFTGNRCTCGTDNTWSCNTDCPMALPEDDAACDRSEQATCRYNAGALVSGFGGTSDASCTCKSMKFACLTQADCPMTAPENDAACTDLTGLSCTYPDRRCSCGMNGWSCQSDCPEQPPSAGASCLRAANMACRYSGGAPVMGGGQADETCVCLSNAFTCYTAADCPSAMPTSATACEQPGISCAFGNQNCRCSTSSKMWTCNMSGGPMGGGGAGGAAQGGGGAGPGGGGAAQAGGGAGPGGGGSANAAGAGGARGGAAGAATAGAGMSGGGAGSGS